MSIFFLLCGDSMNDIETLQAYVSQWLYKFREISYIKLIEFVEISSCLGHFVLVGQSNIISVQLEIVAYFFALF